MKAKGRDGFFASLTPEQQKAALEYRGNDSLGGLTVDGQPVQRGRRVYFELPLGTEPGQAGVYTVTQAGDSGAPFELTRVMSRSRVALGCPLPAGRKRRHECDACLAAGRCLKL